MSIRLRLTCWHAGLLGLVLAGFAALVSVAVERQLNSELDYAIHLQALDASRTVHTISLGPPGTQPGEPELPLGATLADQVLFIQVMDPAGRVTATYGSLAQPVATPRANLQMALAGREVHTTLSLPGERIELYSMPLAVDGALLGVLQVGASRSSLESSLLRLRLVLAAVVLGAVALSAGFGWLLAAKAMRPVDRLTRAADEIGRSTDLARRLVEPRQRDELGRLAATFNQMLGRLDQTVGTQRRFLADASHELRTPLAVIRTNLEAMLHGRVTKEAERDETLRSAVRETERMGRLVADLLALARADSGQPLDRRPLALDRLLLEVYQEGLALAEGVSLSLGELEQVEVSGDVDRLRQLLLNLVDNALRYTPRGGSVTLELVESGGWAVLRVRDTGVGIPPEHLPRIFERFYRVDGPRTRGVGGTGLGLAIARWVAEAHGGRIEVDSRVGVGSTFTLRLPTSRPAGVGRGRPAATGQLAGAAP